MNMKMTTTRQFFSLAIGSLVAGLVAAGTLEPPGPPAPTMVTLQAIYDAVTTIPGQAGSLQPPGGAPAPTMVTLQNISDNLATPAPVGKTGQTSSYAPGDDGALQKGVSVSPRFTDNGNGTVKDNLTGLIWLKNAGCFGARSWTGALSVSNSLSNGNCGLTDGSLAGDWRLPNVKELQSLIDFGRFVPALPLGRPFFGAQSVSYWSSTSLAASPGGAWSVILDYGNVHYYDKSITVWVWPVRGGP